MASVSAIDDAFRRGETLTAILEWAYEQARRNPTEKRWCELGITSEFEPKERMVAEIDATFNALIDLVEHVKILDMAAAFERASQQRLGTRIGAARSAHAAAVRKGSLRAYTARFIRERHDYGSLKAVADLLKEHIDAELLSTFESVRDARNNFAHGTDLRSAPVVEAERARDSLKEVLDYL